MVAAQTIKLIDVSTDDQRADFLTKISVAKRSGGMLVLYWQVRARIDFGGLNLTCTISS
jgi:hypothetical protein